MPYSCAHTPAPPQLTRTCCAHHQHESVIETAEDRVPAGKPVGRDFLPLAEAPEVQKLVFDPSAATGRVDATRPRPARATLQYVGAATASVASRAAMDLTQHPQSRLCKQR